MEAQQASSQQDAIKNSTAAWGTYLDKVDALNAAMFARPYLGVPNAADSIAFGREIMARAFAAQAAVVDQWSKPLNTTGGLSVVTRAAEQVTAVSSKADSTRDPCLVGDHG